MVRSARKRGERYRVWLSLQGGEDGPQQDCSSTSAIVLEPAEQGSMSARQAARYVAAFNRAATAHGRAVRAFALPVAVRYEGDPLPGQSLEMSLSCRYAATGMT